MTAANLIGNIIFSAIGFGAFVYGKKNKQYKAMTIGLILMIYPYFNGHTFWIYVIGVALTTALFLFRD
ncbi:MAG: amino acid transport protein [Candidatus Omnitrophica bacterium]|nr:amino acid transport protein [Candidatus Omnitrophota bacterium]